MIKRKKQIQKTEKRIENEHERNILQRFWETFAWGYFKLARSKKYKICTKSNQCKKSLLIIIILKKRVNCRGRCKNNFDFIKVKKVIK